MNKILFPEIFRVACHTKNVGPNTTFVAIRGTKDDGSKYILEAINKGATTIVIDNEIILNQELQTLILDKKINVLHVANTRKALAELSAEANNYPANKLKIIGITGTKGKSTTTYLIHHILTQAGYRTAMLSTVSNKILDSEMPRSLTTEQPDYLHEFFSLCQNNNIEYVVMEVAAQAFTLHRVDGIKFDAAVFTNFDLEHGEFYSTMESYFAAKLQIFSHLKPHAKLLIHESLQETISNLGFNFETYGFSENTEFPCQILQNDISGLICRIDNNSKDILSTHMLGEFNALNITAAYAICMRLGVIPTYIRSAVATFTGVPGRLNFYKLPNGASGVIDYAHNPSSYEAVLSSLKNLNKNSELIVIFGAGGERDHTKRPIMGSIAAKYAKTIILTSDNPRTEDPYQIALDIKLGIPESAHVIIELDRELAIKHAYNISNANSIIVILGKGPDEYQIVQGVKTYFSESKILSSL